MATCPKCNFQNENDPAVVFCQSCGARLPVQKAPDERLERLEQTEQRLNRAGNQIMSFQFWLLILVLIIACVVIGWRAL